MNIGERMRLMRRRSLLLRYTPIALSLSVTACGGGTDVDSVSASSNEEILPAVAKAQVAAAASAAATEDVSRDIAMRVNSSGLNDDSMTDRFIVKYRDGSRERKDPNATQSKLTLLAGALPSKARHSRRMGIGADVIATERKLNAKDAKAFMRAIASDPNVEYVEPGIKSAGIRAEGAWDIAKGRGAVIGVIDTGITHHSDLDANILPGYEFVGARRLGWRLDVREPVARNTRRRYCCGADEQRHRSRWRFARGEDPFRESINALRWRYDVRCSGQYHVGRWWNSSRCPDQPQSRNGHQSEFGSGRLVPEDNAKCY